MNFNRKNYSVKLLLKLHREMVLSRLIEEKMLIMLRQGKITKWFSGIGQEAVSVGATMALQDEEYILPLHRNLGVFTARDIPLEKLFAQFQGKLSGFTKGRDRSFHFGTKEHHIIGMISHLGAQMAVADGIALAQELKGEKKCVLVFTGDGGSSEGDFHEALNVAAVWDLPVIFLVENNGYSISTPTNEQYKIESFTEKGAAYGIQTKKIDGNNILEVYAAIEAASRNIRRKSRPVLIEAVTFRMRGHEESSGVDYVPEQLFEEWAKKDPIENYENYLIKSKLLTQEQIDDIYKELQKQIDVAVEIGFGNEFFPADAERELQDVFAPVHIQSVNTNIGTTKKMRYIDAISDTLRLNMDKYPNLVLMGQDIAEYGGVFKVTQGLVDTFGKERVRNTPLCESAIIGMGLGMSIEGYKAIIEMQFADFITCGFNQLVNNLAKSYYRWGQNADVVIRMPSGAGLGAGPFHSQTNEAWFFHVPGIKLVYPSSPADAKGLLQAAINDPNPVLFFEHKALYRSLQDEVPVGEYTLEIGKGTIVNEGDDLTIITYGMGVHWAKELVKEEGYSVEIVDLRSLMPWDKQLVREAVKKTGRALVLHEDNLTGGIGAELAAWISEHLFEHLDAPVTRVGGLDIPIPFANELESLYLPKERLKEKVKNLLRF